MGENELKKSDKILVAIAIGYGLFIAYNIWGEYAIDCIRGLPKYSFHFLNNIYV